MSTLSVLHTDSPLGPLTLAASHKGLCGVWFEDQKHRPVSSAHWQVNEQHPLLRTASDQLNAYFERTRRNFDLPLDLSQGTPFQQSVWRLLLPIAMGQSMTYGQLASHLNNPQAVRAVGSAVGRNPLSIIVPCHRILGAGGQLTGYAGGLWRKEALLRLEGHPGI